MRGVIVILAFVSAGCAVFGAPLSDQWTKPGSRSGDMAVQLYVCEQWSRNAQHLNDCMTAHGWTQTAANP